MVGVLAMAAAAATPPVRDYEIEVSLSISICWRWVKEGSDLASMRGKKGPGEAPLLCLWVEQSLECVLKPR